MHGKVSRLTLAKPASLCHCSHLIRKIPEGLSQSSLPWYISVSSKQPYQSDRGHVHSPPHLFQRMVVWILTWAGASVNIQRGTETEPHIAINGLKLRSAQLLHVETQENTQAKMSIKNYHQELGRWLSQLRMNMKIKPDSQNPHQRSWVRWYTLVIPVLGKQKEEDPWSVLA